MKQLTLIAIFVANILLATAQKNESYLLVGTYTSPTKSQGIHVLKFNRTTGETTKIGETPITNPSYLAISPNEKYVYSVQETKDGKVSAYSFNKKTGALTLINTKTSGGDNPCYVLVDKTGKWVFVGNYSSGTLSVYRVATDGGLGEPTTIRHEGTGPNKQRQEGPHVHCTVLSPDNKFLFVPDLGIDKVMIYSFNDKTGNLTPAKNPFITPEPGDGPRHFVFSPNGKFAYLVTELTGNVLAFQYSKGTLTRIQRISTVQEGKTGSPGSADIHLSADGKFLYASNRGSFNSIATYSVGADGKLTNIDIQSTLGRTPRNFNLDPSGNFVLVANQGTDEVVIFNRDKTTGKLTDSGKRIAAGAPVCIKWID